MRAGRRQLAVVGVAALGGLGFGTAAATGGAEPAAPPSAPAPPPTIARVVARGVSRPVSLDLGPTTTATTAATTPADAAVPATTAVAPPAPSTTTATTSTRRASAAQTTTTAPAPAPPPSTTTTTTPPPPPPPADPVEAALRRWFGDVYEKARSVAQCESSLNPSARSAGGGNHGLFQINTVHADDFAQVTGAPFFDGVYDADLNAQFARWLYDRQGWQPWTCA